HQRTPQSPVPERRTRCQRSPLSSPVPIRAEDGRTKSRAMSAPRTCRRQRLRRGPVGGRWPSSARPSTRSKTSKVGSPSGTPTAVTRFRLAVEAERDAIRRHPYRIRPAQMNVADCIVANAVLPDPRYELAWNSIVVPLELKERVLHAALLALRLRPVL